MDPSRIAASLKSARERMGWSREALAFHSGLSWAAIAQIESGRRQQVRASSLVALASALGVSVDYLVGSSATVSPQLLAHRVLIYTSDDEYLASAVPFLLDGLARSEAVLCVPTIQQERLLRDALGDEAHRVEFLDSGEWYRTLRGASSGYLAYVKDRFEHGAPWVRILADAVWAGRSGADVVEWFRYESMVNLALATAPATIVCTYDSRPLNAEVLATARSTHPELVAAGDTTENLAYREPLDFVLGSG